MRGAIFLLLSSSSRQLPIPNIFRTLQISILSIFVYAPSFFLFLCTSTLAVVFLFRAASIPIPCAIFSSLLINPFPLTGPRLRLSRPNLRHVRLPQPVSRHEDGQTRLTCKQFGRRTKVNRIHLDRQRGGGDMSSEWIVKANGGF